MQSLKPESYHNFLLYVLGQNLHLPINVDDHWTKALIDYIVWKLLYVWYRVHWPLTYSPENQQGHNVCHSKGSPDIEWKAIGWWEMLFYSYKHCTIISTPLNFLNFYSTYTIKHSTLFSLIPNYLPLARSRDLNLSKHESSLLSSLQTMGYCFIAFHKWNGTVTHGGQQCFPIWYFIPSLVEIWHEALGRSGICQKLDNRQILIWKTNHDWKTRQTLHFIKHWIWLYNYNTLNHTMGILCFWLYNNFLCQNNNKWLQDLCIF